MRDLTGTFAYVTRVNKTNDKLNKWFMTAGNLNHISINSQL